ncbi:uncharacterized protein LOC132198987 [Neocloeon triangulifer]|uniref:uncharacterized protein LOC132198987 n=1 Tax=Neocloeon triangulifer TaxID=2078957 RepID=UPI00286F32CF|nr:uncharacterized protein LOC132198987 [Neocloeon triangulifer]
MRLTVGVIALSVLLAASGCCAKRTIITNRNLLEDIFEFVDLVPLDEIEAVINKWIDADATVSTVFEFLQSARYRELIDQESHIADFHAYLQFLQDSRAPAYDMWNLYRMYLGLDQIDPPAIKKLAANRQLDSAPLLSMVDECLAQINKADFEKLYNRKLVESEDFKYFVDRMNTDEHINVQNALRENPQFKEIVDEYLVNGYDMYGVFRKIFTFFFPDSEFYKGISLQEMVNSICCRENEKMSCCKQELKQN